MLPIRHKWIFKNRWIALLWAGGILWGAIEFADNHSSNSNGANSNDDMAAAQAVTNAFDSK